MQDRGHIHLDAVGGIAGDMFVAAMLDAFPNLRPRIFADLAAVLPAECGNPVLREGISSGITVVRFALEPPSHGHDPAHQRHSHHDHAHHHAHGSHHHHDHDHGAAHHQHAEHSHHHATSFAALSQRIAAASLTEGTAQQAIAILRRLAEVESRMHGVPVEDVHFHELADWDSLMDVVAAGSIVAALSSFTWSVSDLPRGGGLVRTQHGLLPVPAPATAALLEGFRWREDSISGERVTPTGAAILAHIVGHAAPPSGRVLRATGTGAGTRDLPGMPNILRALVFAEAAPAQQTDEVAVLSFDIDDMTGEEIGVAADRLRALGGVLDLSIGMRSGKKGRPIADLRLLVRPEMFDQIAEACFRETSTLGLRWRIERRLCLPRQSDEIACDGAVLHRKSAVRPGGEVTVKLESDDLRGIEGLAARRRLARAAEKKDGEP